MKKNSNANNNELLKDSLYTDSPNDKEAKADIITDKSKCVDKGLKEKDAQGKDIQGEVIQDNENDDEDILLSTGEYYHDHENYPTHETFKHPFMNFLSLICGGLSCLCCVCASPTPIFDVHLIYMFPALLFSLLGTILFIFDLIKTKTANGLSIAGLIVSLVGGIISIINLGFIAISFIVFKVFPQTALFAAAIASIIMKILHLWGAYGQQIRNFRKRARYR